MTPDEYCQQRTEQAGSSFAISFLFLPPPQRQAMTALYAFCREVDDVVDECQDSGVARQKLAWWRDELDRLYHATPHHPVTQALAPAIARYQLPQAWFSEIIDGMAMDLEQQRYASFRELGLYCYRVAGVVGQLAAQIFGYQQHATRRYAHHLGLAFQLTNIIRDVGEDAERGRIYLPLDELAAAGIDEQQILNRQMSPPLQQLLQQQAARAHHYYQLAYQQLPEADRYAQRSGLIMAAIYQSTLQRLERQQFPIFERRVSLPPWQKLWLAWRVARGERRRQQRWQRQQA